MKIREEGEKMSGLCHSATAPLHCFRGTAPAVETRRKENHTPLDTRRRESSGLMLAELILGPLRDIESHG
jgi:hypothetical protein